MNIIDNLFTINFKNNIGLNGLTDESFCIYINEVFNSQDKSILILTPTLFEANKLLNSLSSYTSDVLFFPMDDFLTSMAIATSPDLQVTRLETINELLKNKKKILVTHLMGYLRFLPTKEEYRNHILNLEVGQEYDIKKLTSDLYDIGYTKEIMVTKTTDMAIRGFIVDIFPIGENHPVRIEYFGDEIDSIRYFDEDTQKSIETIKKITIYPATEFIADNIPNDIDKSQKLLPQFVDQISSIKDYLNEHILVIKDYAHLKNLYQETKDQMIEYKTEKDQDFTGDYMLDLKTLENPNTIYYLAQDNLLADIKLDDIIDFKVKEIPQFHENIDVINKYLNENYAKTIIICLKKYQIKTFSKHISVPYIITDLNNVIKNTVNLVAFDMNSGFNYQETIFITDKELFNVSVTKKHYKTKFKYSTKIKDINKLENGDYIVHSINGIGVYNGIKTLTTNGLKKDYIELLYKGNDKLYIPVEKIDVISKFSGKEGVIPKVNGLGTSEWHKTKMRVTDKVRNVAQELLKIYAEREIKKGFQFAKDDELQIMFEQEFEYQPTSDQNLAIQQIKEEMETSHPMDRLLCGDVGFGKTEVAFRAIFKAIMNGKQVIYLCPTTILAMQQYNNAIERFKNFPVNIALLNRFITPKKANETIEKFNKGTIDFLIGTHRVLSNDIKPKDLGLLVIDEEQRFGVTHKEKIKKYKSDIDVLTLTATPIPRTLQMSLVGIRSLSLITTPPVNRYPIQTYVVEESKQLIKDAIYKELARSGQVFILYNHVDLIEHKVYEIQELVPDAKIIFAHGRMNRNEIEDRMMKFINHEADIMICTTIIETGIDIPNVNTLIILEADHFGLSQLYQIRGRVGRSDKIAYAYMMYKSGHILGESAVKRLKAIEEFTELGSGFKIANRDLSIRGAGDILGSEQAGFIDSVGVDLYLKILNDEVKRLKGEIVDEEETDNKALINVTTHISDDYVIESELKIEIHKMINTIDSYEKLLEVRTELEDRFGKIDKEVEVYMYEEWFEKMAKKLDIIKVNQTKTSVELIFSAEKTKQLNGEKLFIDAYEISPHFKFNYKNLCLSIILEIVRLEKHYIYYLIDLLKTIE